MGGWLNRAATSCNALCLILALMFLGLGAFSYPSAAQALLADHRAGTLSYIAIDAALCFGPLLGAGGVSVSARALLGEWRRERSAARLTVVMTGFWGATAAVWGVVV